MAVFMSGPPQETLLEIIQSFFQRVWRVTDVDGEHDDVLVVHVSKDLADNGRIAIDFFGTWIDTSKPSTFLKRLSSIVAYAIKSRPNLSVL